MAELISQGKCRGLLPDGKSDGHGLDGSDLDGFVVERAVDGDRLAEASGD